MTLNEIEQRLEALQAEKDKLTAELERLKAEEAHKEVKPWRAASGDIYYGISSNGTPFWSWEDGTSLANIRYDNGNYYRTRELAEQDAKELALRGRVRQLRDALCEGYQFTHGKHNYLIFYSHIDKCFKHDFIIDSEDIGTIWFDTKEHAQQACDILNAERGKESGGNG